MFQTGQSVHPSNLVRTMYEKLAQATEFLDQNLSESTHSEEPSSTFKSEINSLDVVIMDALNQKELALNRVQRIESRLYDPSSANGELTDLRIRKEQLVRKLAQLEPSAKLIADEVTHMETEINFLLNDLEKSGMLNDVITDNAIVDEMDICKYNRYLIIDLVSKSKPRLKPLNSAETKDIDEIWNMIYKCE
uniref:Uncharacterized protein n=1 Tax=Romanomermis culicivorax TaxID=13658 RepID=A0A915ISZ6_ROMCU